MNLAAKGLPRRCDNLRNPWAPGSYDAPALAVASRLSAMSSASGGAASAALFCCQLSGLRSGFRVDDKPRCRNQRSLAASSPGSKTPALLASMGYRPGRQSRLPVDRKDHGLV
jgi:hypothetical protein